MKLKLLSIFVFGVALFIISCKKNQPAEKTIHPGEIWSDTDGNPINAHGAGILFHQGKYYWFGEYKKGKTWLVENMNWECYRVNAGGVSCYSSENLTDWKFEGIALAPDTADSLPDMHIRKVIGGPKVIYNEETKKFVLCRDNDVKD